MKQASMADLVKHTERGENTRIISAWRANSRQRKQYEEGS